MKELPFGIKCVLGRRDRTAEQKARRKERDAQRRLQGLCTDQLRAAGILVAKVSREPPEYVLAEAREAMASPRTITQVFCGDPPANRSALAQRNSSSSHDENGPASFAPARQLREASDRSEVSRIFCGND